jgi:hypothetical protein
MEPEKNAVSNTSPLPPEPTQPVQLIPVKKDYGLTIILSVLLIIIAAIAAILYFQNQKLIRELARIQTLATPTAAPDPTANWKTYTNSKYEFEFKYPSDWDVRESDFNYTNAIVEFEKDKSVVLSILSDQKKYNSLDQYLGTQNSVAKDISVGNIPAKYISFLGDGGHTLSYKRLVFFTEEKNVLDLYYNWEFYDKNESDKTFDQILSTFKLLGNQVTGDPMPCGGSLGLKCPTGYACSIPALYPDATGTCEPE